MAITTHVNSINGYTGTPPFKPEPKIELDSEDIHITGSTGDTVKDKVTAIANGMQILTAEKMKKMNDYKITIGSYPLVTVE